jgi:hypothetical protein
MVHGGTPRLCSPTTHIAADGGELGRDAYRDIEPNLASIRNEPEFKAVFADIERDMAKQRAALAARPKDVPLVTP